MNNTRKRKSGVTKHVHLCSVIVIVELTTKQLREVVTQSLRRIRLSQKHGENPSHILSFVYFNLHDCIHFLCVNMQ